MFFRPRTRSRRSSIGIEQLEVRIVPTVTVNLVGHHLFIKGDDVGDKVDIEGTELDQGEVNVLVNDDETSDSPYTGVTRITARFGSGDDELNVKDIDIAGKLDVRMKGGDDTFTLDGSVIGGRTEVYLRSGNDEATITGSVFAKKVTIFLQGGDDLLTVSENTFNARFEANGGGDVDTFDDDGTNNYLGRNVVKKFETLV